MAKTKVTKGEIDETQKLANMVIAIVDGREAHVALGAMLLASAMYGQFIRIPIENLCAIFDNTVEETYTVLGKEQK